MRKDGKEKKEKLACEEGYPEGKKKSDSDQAESIICWTLCSYLPSLLIRFPGNSLDIKQNAKIVVVVVIK
jgi:hypothetical protein